MQTLQLINCITLLTQSKTFSIGGTLYRYSHESGSLKSPQYYFEPLPQQKKTAILKLNKDKVLRRCFEVPALRNQHHAQIINQGIQQALF